MATRSILVQLPPYPFTIESFRPNALLAGIASVLEESGHTTSVFDYGTVECFDRLYAPEVRSQMLRSAGLEVSKYERLSRTLTVRSWYYGQGARQVRAAHRSFCDEIADAACSFRSLDFVVLSVETSHDFKSGIRFAQRMRERRPGVAIVAAGSYFSSQPSSIALMARHVSCVYVGRASSHFTELAEEISQGGELSKIPGAWRISGGKLSGTPSSAVDIHGLSPTPLYHPEVYPALSDDTKIRVFDIEVFPGEARVRSEFDAAPLRKSARAVGDEVAEVHALFGTRAFHFSGCDGCPRSTDALSFELMSRRLGIRYSRDADVAAASFSTIAAMKGSGCAVLSFEIHSGSQRLLDDFYETYLSVSTIEDVVETASRSELYTIAAFTYPCALDDYHTRAETLRLIDRSRPDAAPVRIPSLELQHEEGTDGAGTIAPGPGAVRRSYRAVQQDRARLCMEIEALGVATDMTAQIALMATLAGDGSRETDFLDEFDWLLMFGDALGVADRIDAINRGARANATLALKPFVPFQNVVGN